MNKLLTRKEFRDQCLERDKHQCVVCHSNEHLSVHHLLEKDLFSSPEEKEGYFKNNGVTVCEDCHYKAEQTLISCEALREFAGIKEVVLPEHLDPKERYTKWGDIINPDGSRSPGEMFDQPQVQKVLKEANLLSLYNLRFKYPRTFHLPFSREKADDDKILSNCDHFIGKEIIVSEKLDGENTTLYDNYLHARSLENNYHPSRTWIRQFHASIKHEIPPGWRFCGENIFAQHSLSYDSLDSYFYLFSIWNSQNICLSWEETKEWAQLLNIIIVPVLYRGIWDEKLVKDIYENLDTTKQEGIVVRLADSFHYKDFKYSLAKAVRKGHVKPDDGHWATKPVIPNKLKGT